MQEVKSRKRRMDENDIGDVEFKGFANPMEYVSSQKIRMMLNNPEIFLSDVEKKGDLTNNTDISWRSSGKILNWKQKQKCPLEKNILDESQEQNPGETPTFRRINLLKSFLDQCKQDRKMDEWTHPGGQ